MFAEELSRRFDAHAAADRRGSVCLLIGLTLVAVMLLQQAVAVSDDTDASNALYGAVLRGLLIVAPIYFLARVVAAARMRAAAEETARARAVALAARLGEDSAAAGVPLNHPLLAFALPQHAATMQGAGVMAPPSMAHRQHVVHVMHELDAENDAAARRTEHAVIAYLDAAAAAQAQARAAAAHPGRAAPPPARPDEFV